MIAHFIRSVNLLKAYISDKVRKNHGEIPDRLLQNQMWSRMSVTSRLIFKSRTAASRPRHCAVAVWPSVMCSHCLRLTLLPIAHLTVLKKKPITTGVGRIFFQKGPIVDLSGGWQKWYFPGDQQWWNFILPTPTLREKHFSTAKLTAKYQISKPRGGQGPPDPFRRSCPSLIPLRM